MGARRLVFLIGLLALPGCGGGAAVNRAPAPAPCATRVLARNPSDTLTVVLFDKVDLSHAPWGRNREERFIFSHLYETLLTIDCHGEFQSGLAKTVVEASDGWLVTLRDDAHFWDESPVTAQDVVESFKPAIAGGIAIKSVDPIDGQQFLVRGYDARPDVKLLTLQMLSVAKPSPTAGPPIGTGSWMLDENVPVAEAVVIHPVLATAPVVRFVRGNVSDARDIMDGTADAMITDDPAAIEYAPTKERVSLAPLAWDQVYVLVSRMREEMVRRGRTVADLPQGLCDALARDAVAVDARGGSSILRDSWKASSMFISGMSFSGNRSASNQIVFDREDPTGRALAERIVALTAMDTTISAEARAVRRAMPGAGPAMRAVGLDADEHAKRFYSYEDEADCVITLSWCTDFPFLARHFGRRAPWLMGSQELSRALIPLIETRAHFVAISDRISFIDEHNGNVRIMIPGEDMRR